VIGEAISGDYFSALEVKSAAGRLLDRKDDEAPEPVMVLSQSFWARRFHADPSIIGRTVQYEEMPFRVIGIAQAGFRGVDAGIVTDVWVPVKVVDKQMVASGISSNWLRAMVRTKDANAAQGAIEGRFQRHIAEEELPRATATRYLQSLKSQRIALRPAASGLASEGRPYERALIVLMGIVGVVLLISCANVANLLLARNVSRRQEIAIRMALGAGRARLASQLLSESLTLALAGTAMGLGIGIGGCRLLLQLLPPSRVPLDFDLRPDRTVLAFAALMAVATAVLCGAGPVWRAWRSTGGLRHDGMRVTERSFGRKLLVAGQLALSLILVAGAGLFLKTLHGLAATDLGFRPEQVMAFEISFPRAAPKEHRAQVSREMLERLTAGQGISATYASPGVYEHGAGRES
jgi:predicted permease